MTDSQFLMKFEKRQLDRSEWTHEAHVRMAWLYVTKTESYRDARSKVRTGIKKLNAAFVAQSAAPCGATFSPAMSCVSQSSRQVLPTDWYCGAASHWLGPVPVMRGASLSELFADGSVAWAVRQLSYAQICEARMAILGGYGAEANAAVGIALSAALEVFGEHGRRTLADAAARGLERMRFRMART